MDALFWERSFKGLFIFKQLLLQGGAQSGMSQTILLVDLDYSLKSEHVLFLVVNRNRRLFFFLGKIDGDILRYFLVS